jgi:hypothetical protein
MLLYNNNGTVSSILASPGPDGKMTSSAEVFPTINTSGSTGNINTVNFAFHNTVSKSSATVDINSRQPVAASYPTRTENNFSSSYYYPLMISYSTTLNQIIDDRISADIDTTSLQDGSTSPKLKSVTAQKFTTTYSNGQVVVVGDDVHVQDVNLGNGIGIRGEQNATRGWVKFGTNGPLVGFNSTAAKPSPGDGLYAITGSLLISASKLLYYNGAAGNSGWSVIV